MLGVKTTPPFDAAAPGSTPYTLLDYFPTIFSSSSTSRTTIPQIRGMYNGDRARKQVLVDWIRLPSALDNRPLRFDEFEERVHQVIYVPPLPAV